MKLAASSILILLFLLSCNKDKVQPVENIPEIILPQATLIVGDNVSNNIHFVSYSPLITLQDSHNSDVIHEIDINSDGTNDFQLKQHSYFAFAGTWYKGTQIKINSLHSGAEISRDPMYPDSNFFFAQQYFENDSLDQQSLWASDDVFISANGDDFTDLCDAPGCPMISHGSWFGLSNQYIGIRMDGTNLGWIKISLPVTDPNGEQTLVIEEYAYDL